MPTTIYIASDDSSDRNSDFMLTMDDTDALEKYDNKTDCRYGKSDEGYVIPRCPAVDELKKALFRRPDVSGELNDLINQIDKNYPSFGLLTGKADFKILIHFGKLRKIDNKEFTRIMDESSKGKWSGSFSFEAASRSWAFPKIFWKNGSFRFPKGNRSTQKNAPPALPHLKRFYHQCRNILAQKNVLDRFKDRDFWLDTIWNGRCPNFEDAFSEDEKDVLSKNEEMKDFFSRILTPPAGAATTASATSATPGAATGASTTTGATSSTATAAGTTTTTGTTTGTGAGTSTAAGAGTTGTGAATIPGTPPVTPGAPSGSLTEAVVFKIISQIMQIFNPPEANYVPLRFSRMPYLLSFLCALLIVGLLIVMPSIIRVIPRKAEYETVKEEITTKGNPSIIDEVIQDKAGNNQTDDKPTQTQKTGDGTQGKTVNQEIPAPTGQSVPVSRNPAYRFSSIPTGDKRSTRQLAFQLLLNPQTTVVNTEGGKNDDEYRYSMETRMAAPIQYFYLILLFAVYTLAGVLCFIMFLKLLKKHSREQKIQNQEQYFRNLSRLTSGLEQEDEQDIVKQFAQSSLRLYFNGDEGD